LELANIYEFDIIEAARNKLLMNEEKYPADIVRGKADKYTKYQ